VTTRQGHASGVFTELVNAALLFFAVLGASVTLHSGVFAVGVYWQSAGQPQFFASLGRAVDAGVLFGFLFGLPVAAFLAALRASGWDIG
jgi:hypothetical protein